MQSDEPEEVSLQLLLMNLLALPGFGLSVLAMDRLGPRCIQAQGFALSGACFALLGAFDATLRRHKAVHTRLASGPSARRPPPSRCPRVRGRACGDATCRAWRVNVAVA